MSRTNGLQHTMGVPHKCAELSQHSQLPLSHSSYTGCCRINTKTGEVRRKCLFAQSNDHPRVNPSFYSRPTRYCFVNMCMTEDADISNPPQVGPQPALLAPDPGSADPVTHASNIVPAPAFSGKTHQSVPEQTLHVPASADQSDFTWTTRGSPSASSVLPTDLPNNVPQSHACAPADSTPYTSVPLPVGGVPVQPTSPFRQSLLTAKDRLEKLSQADLSILSMLRDDPRASEDDQKDQGSQAGNRAPTPEGSCTLSTSVAVESSVEEDDAFPVSAVKVQGRQAGSTRAMGSLEWLSLCSGPPKAKSLTICPVALSKMPCPCPIRHLISPIVPVAWYPTSHLPSLRKASLRTLIGCPSPCTNLVTDAVKVRNVVQGYTSVVIPLSVHAGQITTLSTSCCCTA